MQKKLFHFMILCGVISTASLFCMNNEHEASLNHPSWKAKKISQTQSQTSQSTSSDHDNDAVTDHTITEDTIHMILLMMKHRMIPVNEKNMELLIGLYRELPMQSKL